ncbi:cobalt ECF transporter T component CbiQ [Thiorhodococcus mannitoliphagus]|uniref:Cobalt ECF transporter T component CbiQ n=2 Tax=Thiorhodococcus mannitoliphagus TaxID=329406 RepID=A0A6P1DR47_9GAMM|nr:cobalt ECF transporter T component CbiQ [Thiorhodococcus mannitoliphagus]NEX20508.1 cobalt ECF transporter T component CbiQ [Thiorhodococcus mannitoliphagus]
MSERDPRLRIVAAIAFALVTVSLATIAGAAAALVCATALAMTAGMQPRALGKRLLALEGFVLILLLTLPFTTPGTTVLRLGPLTASAEGLHLAALILLKANAVVLALLALVGTLEPIVLGHALARLGAPEKLAHLLLMTVRQIHLLHAELGRLRQAMRARAFVPRSDSHTWRSYGWLMGMLLVRSLDHAQRVLAAMRCRCFDGRLYLLDSTAWATKDTIAALGFTVLLLALPLLDLVQR